MKIPPALSRIVPGGFEVTPPVITLLCSNIITIVLAVAGNWDAATVLFIYWAQSIIIGIFTVISLIRADTAALTADISRSAEENVSVGMMNRYFARYYKYFIAGFFALHYGLFHVVYYEFIVDSGFFGVVDFSSPEVWASCGLFFVNHLYSSLYYRHDERKGGVISQKSLPTRIPGSSRCTLPSSSGRLSCPSFLQPGLNPRCPWWCCSLSSRYMQI